MIKQLRSSHEKSREDMGMSTWYSGVSSNSDLKRIGFDRWMESFQDPEKVKKRRGDQLNTGKELWKQFNRGKI